MEFHNQGRAKETMAGERGRAKRRETRRGRREGGGTAKRKGSVVNPEADKVEREGDRGGGREKYGCAEGERELIKDGGRQIGIEKGSRGE